MKIHEVTAEPIKQNKVALFHKHTSNMEPKSFQLRIKTKKTLIKGNGSSNSGQNDIDETDVNDDETEDETDCTDEDDEEDDVITKRRMIILFS